MKKSRFEDLLSPVDKLRLVQQKLDAVCDLLQDVRDEIRDNEMWDE